MRSLLHALRDIWCAVSHRCPVGRPDNPLLVTLRIHERAALRAAKESRQRQHYIEDELLMRLHGTEGRHARHD